MGGLFSGLEKFGIDVDSSMGIFDEEEKKEAAEEKKEAKVVNEADFLLDKTFKCPICLKEFKSKQVKASKLRRGGTDKDLRPIYSEFDVNKYGVTLCTNCGYAALDKFFKALPSAQEKLIQETISAKFNSDDYKNLGDTYDYDTAIERYKLALLNTIVKKGKISERAYTCLKIAWVIRGKGEALNPDSENYAVLKNDCDKEETAFLKNALEGLMKAVATESFPICGMDEATVDYIIVVLAMRFKQYELASKTLSGILTSSNANRRIKDKAFDLKEELVAEIKASKAGK